MELRYVGHGVVNEPRAAAAARSPHRAVKVAATFATVSKMNTKNYTLTHENFKTLFERHFETFTSVSAFRACL